MKKTILALVLVLALLCSTAVVGVAAESDGDNVLRLYTDRVYRTFNQWMNSDGDTFNVVGAFSECLLRLDENNNPQPGLAESYTVSEDGTVYTFTLRDGLVWSDGRALTAHDFEYSWLKSIESTDYGYATTLAPFFLNGEAYMNGEAEASEVGIKALDDKTFEVTLAAPTAFFDRFITLPVFCPLNEEFVAEEGDQYALTADDLLYCGPFICTDFDLAVGATLVKNPDYWDADSVKLDGVEFKVITDPAAALNAYEAGEIDRVNLTSTDIMNYSSDPNFGTYSDFRNYFIQFDVSNPEMNLNLRKAISYAIDRDLLVNGVLMTGAVAAGGVVSQGLNGDGEKTFRELVQEKMGGVDVSRFDAELAKEYWDKGVEELGHEPKLELLTATGVDFDDMAVYIQDQLRQVLGVECTINAMTQQARNDVMNAGNYCMALNAWGADYDDAMTFLELWTSGTGYRGNYNDEEYNAMIDAIRSEADADARLQMMVDAEIKLIDTDCVVTGLYDRGFSYLLNPAVKNLIYHPVGQPIEVKYAYIEG